MRLRNIRRRLEKASVGRVGGCEQSEAARFAHVAAHEVLGLQKLADAHDVEGAGVAAVLDERAKPCDLRLRHLQPGQNLAHHAQSAAHAHGRVGCIAVQPGAQSRLLRADAHEERLAVLARVLGDVVHRCDSQVRVEHENVGPLDRSSEHVGFRLVGKISASCMAASTTALRVSPFSSSSRPT
jgi:hypothetical protein